MEAAAVSNPASATTHHFAAMKKVTPVPNMTNIRTKPRQAKLLFWASLVLGENAAITNKGWTINATALHFNAFSIATK